MVKKKKNSVEESVVPKKETVIEIQKDLEHLKEVYYIRLRERAFRKPIKFIYEMDKNELINKFKVIKVSKNFKNVVNFKYKIKYFNDFFIVFQDANNFEKFKKDFELEINYILKVNFEDCWKRLLDNETELVVASDFIKENKLQEFNLF